MSLTNTVITTKASIDGCLCYSSFKTVSNNRCDTVNSYHFWWDEENIEHIANHGVEPLEAEVVVEYARLICKAGRGKYVAFGQTDAGRFLMVVNAPKEHRRLRVVTARDMTSAEKNARFVLDRSETYA